jgi:hypothetical protein
MQDRRGGIMTATAGCIGLANVFNPSEGWIHLTPYGRFPHSAGVQVIDRATATGLKAKMQRDAVSKGPRFVGVPLYIGHPDVPEIANEYPDKKAYGWIVDTDVREDGLWGRVKFSAPGKQLVSDGHWKFVSPYWLADESQENGAKIFHPREILSVGLTNRPNLPVKPLSNESNMKALGLFNSIVAQLQAGRQCSYDEAYQLARLANPELYAEMHRKSTNVNRFANEVAKQAKKAEEDRRARLANIMKGYEDRGISDYDVRWKLAKAEHAALFNEMTSPGGPDHLMPAADDQHLRPDDWSKVDPLSLGLPLNASEESKRMFLAAEQVSLTPEIAALVVRTAVQFCQIEHGAGFDSVMDSLKEHRPEIYNSAIKAQVKTN